MAFRSRRAFAAIVALTIVAFACAPQSAGPSTGAAQAGPAPAASVPAHASRVSIGTWAEIPTLQPKLMNRPAAGYHLDAGYLVNSPFVVLDPTGAPHPRLAAELPSRDRGSWVVNPDGTMATTWKIQPNAAWHDGQPVTSRDAVFALKVYKDPQIVVASRDPERLIDRVDALDDKTFVVYWTQTYPWANRLLATQLDPLPEHLLAAQYEADKELFQNSAFWTGTTYIGDGPYRLTDWTRGSELVYRAFDQYFLGRPNIEEVSLKIISDPSAVVGFVLGDAVDVTVNQTMNQKAWLAVKQQWDGTGEGHIALLPVHLRATLIQFHPERVKLQAMLDVRVRRALVHALDRPAIADAVLEGASMAADLMMTPQDPLYSRAQQVIGKYPYDVTRALALLQDAGWTLRGNTLINSSGEQFSMANRTTEMADNLTEMRIMSDYYARIGIDTLQTGVPEARNRDNEYRAYFPHLNITGQIIDLPKSLYYYSETECPASERQFIGQNRGCWQNPEYDRLFKLAMTSLDDDERASATVDAFKIVTNDVAVIPMSYNLDNIAVRKGLIGPGQRWPSAQGDTWNINEWRWE